MRTRTIVPSLKRGARPTTLRLVAVAVALAATALLVNTSSAQAVTTRLTIGSGLSSCPAGYVCLWTLNNYTGRGYAFYNDEYTYALLPSPFNAIDNNSWSFYNHGNTSDVRFYRWSGRSGDHFVLCKGEHIARVPSSSELAGAPGGNYHGGRSWRDDISGHDWGAWC